MRERRQPSDLAVRVAADVVAGFIVGALLLISLAAIVHTVSTVRHAVGSIQGVSK